MNIKVFFRRHPRVDAEFHSGTTKPPKLFTRLFGKYLLLTNTLTCGVLMCIGDLIEQEIEITRGQHKGPTLWKRYDWKRSQRMFMVGLIQGPPQHLFYGQLDRLLPKQDFNNISKKILLDQTIASPFCITLFFTGMGIMEGKSGSEIKSELRRKFFLVYSMDWMVWPPVQFLNFYLVPSRYRVLYVNFMTMLYDIYLSYAKHDIKYGS